MNFYRFSKKSYFSYPCPRKLREVVKMTLFEKEPSEKVKEIWKMYYDGKPQAVGMDIGGAEMETIIKKYVFLFIFYQNKWKS